MADLTITAANVIAATGARTIAGTAGATITAGQVVHISPTTRRFLLSDADAAGVGAVTAFYIALNGASNGQPLVALRIGNITIGATMVAGTEYYVSPNPGGICPRADLTAGDNVILLGIASSTTVLKVDPIIPGVTL